MRVSVYGPSLHCGFPGTARRLFLLSLAALLCLSALAGVAGGQEPSKGLSKDQILKLLQGGDPPARVRYLVNQYGIAFPLTPETEKALRDAGANQELIELVRKLAPPVPVVVPPPAPPAPPPPVLTVNVKPGDVEVYVDDERHGLTGPQGVLKVNGLKAGSHTLRLSLAGYQSFETPIQLTDGQSATVAATLQPIPAPAPVLKPPTPAETTTTVHPPPPDPNDPTAPHDPGIYYIQENAGSRRMIPLEPAPLGNQMSTSAFMSRTTWRSNVSGGQARIRIAEARPTFYFYLPAGQASFPGVSTAGFSALSPREFVLARLETKKDGREVPLEKAHSGGGPSGIRSKDTVAFASDKVAPGIYKVRPQAEMTAGEYGFLYAGSVQMPAGRLFDFGIEGAR